MERQRRDKQRWMKVAWPLVLILFYHVLSVPGIQTPQSQKTSPQKPTDPAKLEPKPKQPDQMAPGPKQKQPDQPDMDPRQQAFATIQYLAGVVGMMQNPEQRVIGYSVLGQALALTDQPTSRQYFRQAFTLLEKLQEPKAKGVASETPSTILDAAQLSDLRNEFLSRLTQVDASFARELLNTPEKQPASEDTDNLNPKQRRRKQQARDASLMAEAYQQVMADPAEAAALAQESFASGLPIGTSQLLVRLRQQDPTLAEQVYESAFTAATRLVPPSLDDLVELAPYVFPSAFRVRPARPTDPSRARLYLQSVAASLQDTSRLENAGRNQRGSQQAVRQAVALQQLLPMYELYAPDFLDQLNQVMDQLAVSVPNRAHDKMSAANNSSDPVDALLRQAQNETNPRLRDDLYAQAALVAASKGNMDRAQQILLRIQDSEFRRQSEQEIFFTGAQVALERSQWPVFNTVVRRINDKFARADLLIQAADELIQKNSPDKAVAYLAEANTLLSSLTPSPQQAGLLFSVATTYLKVEPLRTYEIVQASVLVLNKLESTKKEAKTKGDAGLSKTDKLIRQQVETSFRELSRADFDRAIQISTQLQNPEQRVVAQAASCREILRSRTNRSKTLPAH